MEGMSEREYSAHSGLSRGAIQKARKASRLVVYNDGSINAAASDMRRADPRSTGNGIVIFGHSGAVQWLQARHAWSSQEKGRCRRVSSANHAKTPRNWVAYVRRGGLEP
jgi:hypothetical protein